MQNNQVEIEKPEDIHVVLKPILGLEPRYYIGGLFFIIIFAILFCLIVLPGILHPGTKVEITSSPAGAAVYFQEKRYGVTPLEAFLPQGDGVLRIEKPGFESSKSNYSSKNRLFFSLFFPKRDNFSVQLKTISEGSLLKIYHEKLAKWSAAAPFHQDYPCPPIFTDFVIDAKGAGLSQEQIQTILLQDRRFVVDNQLYQDYGKALNLWMGKAPEDLKSQYDKWAELLKVDEVSSRLVFWIVINQEKLVRDNLLASPSDFFKQALAQWQKEQNLPDFQTSDVSGSQSVAGINLNPVPHGAYFWGFIKADQSVPTEAPYMMPVSVKIDSFWLGVREVSQGQYDSFLQSNPDWNPDKKNELVKQGFVTQDYLADWKEGKPVSIDEPVSGVSWFAAQAFVHWLNTSGKVPAGTKAVLPDEAQWEWAARDAQVTGAFKKDGTSKLGFTNLAGGVWEWTASSWAPGDQVVSVLGNEKDDLSFFRTVKGGCKENQDQIFVYSRGALVPNSCNPYLGFRIALVKIP